MCIYAHVHASVFVCMHVHTYACVLQIGVPVCMHTSIYVRAPTCTRMYVCVLRASTPVRGLILLALGWCREL